MGSLFRSEEMALCQLFLQTESAYSCVSELGELGLVQFRDLNPGVNAFNRNFVGEVKRCNEMERILAYVEKEMSQESIAIPEAIGHTEAPLPKEIIDLETTLQKLENDLREANKSGEGLKSSLLELTELKHVLRNAQIFFEEQDYSSMGFDTSQTVLVPPTSLQGGSHAHLGFISGVILREKLQPFEKMLWRVCRGNAFLKQADIDLPLEDPKTGELVFKSVFVIFYQGEQLLSRIKKICDAFRASLYPCPETQLDRRLMASGVMNRIEDLTLVMKETRSHLHRILSAASRNLVFWQTKVEKMKAIYHVMNMCSLDVTRKCLIGEVWSAVADLPKVQMALQRGTEHSGSSVQSIVHRTATKENPPTFNKTNKFTRGFQAIVDSYGVSDYREVNPAPYTIITFPFLFAVMFGDFGHGLIMFLFALWMVLQEKKLTGKYTDNEIWMMFFDGRYIILLMGAFSMYTGLIYNDIFSMSFNIFGSYWPIPRSLAPDDSIVPSALIPLDPGETYKRLDHPYPFGMDPIWQLADNNLSFLNTFKMKTAIILGVSQMLFGVALSALNHWHFRKIYNIVCEFIPQVLFLLCIFGNLVVLIFYKWIYYDASTSGCAPSILNHLINMVMFSYPDTPCYLQKFYPAQQGVQTFLILVAAICIPWMLLAKPLYLRSKAKAAALNRSPVQEFGNPDLVPWSVAHTQEVMETDLGNMEPVKRQTNDSAHKSDAGHEVGHGGGHGDGEFDFGEVMINQTIHTIEYCLGSISHTASYLRLWALSLAHAQLSEVLWSMVLRQGLGMQSYYGSIMLYVAFAVWAALTIGVLLIMEGLSAFLHALRLHWVEFQSKFYGGTGYSFKPFSFDHLELEIIKDN